MRDKKIIVIGVVIACALLLSLYFDSEIVVGVSKIRTDALTNFFMQLTSIYSGFIIVGFLTLLFLWNHDKRKWVLPLWITLALSAIISFLLKVAVQRQRPYQLDLVSIIHGLEDAAHLTWDFGFPSFQTMLVFCALPLLVKKFPNFKYVWIAFAGLVGFSRVYFGVHFLSDVIAGGLIGYLIGAVIIKFEKDNKWFEKIYKKVFN